ncbi:MAG: hypothetical protein FWD23_14130 [Oscillospiraceae bacterium]|nr:hypothetical protein [Oscillospiraceae bacterium]
MKKAISALMAVILVLSILAGCSGETKLTGKYICIDVTGGEDEMSWQDVKEMMGDEWSDPYIEFSDGGKLVMDWFGVSSDGTFKVDGKSVEITIDGDTQKGTIDNNKITISDGDTKMVFEKK